MAKGGGGGGSRGGSRGGGGSSGSGGIIIFPGGTGYHGGGGGGSSSNNNSESSKSTAKVLTIIFSCLGGLILILVALCVRHRIRSRRLQNKNGSVTTLELGDNTAGVPGVHRPADPHTRPSMELPLYTAPGAHAESSTPVTYPSMESTTTPVTTVNASSTIAYPDISTLVSQPPAYSQPANQSDGSSTTTPPPLDNSIYPPMPQGPFDASTPNIYPPMPQDPVGTSSSAPTSNPSSYPPMPQSQSASTTNPTPYPPISQ
ncbi:hypothetical protein BGZ51_004061 [Haplosporangium sp. Z 767]|nr:hypothetical protein BGZ51_004061 [Haplosporangium sp. Z 767]